jgi:hypothetical protein
MGEIAVDDGENGAASPAGAVPGVLFVLAAIADAPGIKAPILNNPRNTKRIRLIANRPFLLPHRAPKRDL